MNHAETEYLADGAHMRIVRCPAHDGLKVIARGPRAHIEGVNLAARLKAAEPENWVGLVLEGGGA